MKQQFFIYTMFDEQLKPLYVGCTNNLKRRVREHRYTNKNNYAYIDWIIVNDVLDAGKKEEQLIDELKPRLNTSSGGYSASIRFKRGDNGESIMARKKRINRPIEVIENLEDVRDAIDKIISLSVIAPDRPHETLIEILKLAKKVKDGLPL
jgi:excinuclease UvrABC nuclease subunit